MAAENDYYAVLGVARDAEKTQIRKAFRERVRACHPDKVANLDEDLRRLAEEKMVELNEAYAVLRNAERRAAYDDRRRSAATRAEPPDRSRNGQQRGAATPPAPPRSREPLVDPAVARGRIGEQQFVARAASEEFQQLVKSSVVGQTTWTPVAFPGATLALHGAKGRSNLYFVLMAAPRVDEKGLRRFLKSSERFGEKLSSRLFGQDRLFGFVGAVEFADREKQRSALERFNRRLTSRDAIRPATLIDLVNWHVVPGEVGLRARLDQLLRGD